MRIAKRSIAEGMVIPRWYGVAYWDWSSPTAICYPIPFNLAIRYIREVWIRLRNPRVNWRERALVAEELLAKDRMKHRGE